MTEIENLQRGITALETQRSTLGDAVVEAMLGPLREKLAALQAQEAATAQRKQVTVLFADISGFTAMSEAMDVEDVTALMNALWRRFDATIIAHGGQIDKHMGDGVMALWGVGQTREDDPEQAVRAALEMQAEVGGRRSEAGDRRSEVGDQRSEAGDSASDFRPPTSDLRPLTSDLRLPTSDFHLRIGVNTGPVLLGVVGTTREYTAMGDTVNLAARLEQVAPLGGVLISQSTYDQVRGLFDVQPQPPLAVKGKMEPVQAFLVQREKPRAFYMQTRGLAGVTTRTIGREAELAVLQESYLRASVGSGMQWVTVTGEAGIGKSRLLTEFERWFELRPEFVWYLKARAWDHTRSIPYFVLRDLFAFRFQIADSDSLAVARAKMVSGLTGILGEESGQEAAAFIGHLIGLDFSTSHWIAPIMADVHQIRGRATVLLSQYLAALCADSPAVLLLEDLQWADDESVALLAEILATPRDWRLCVIGLARPSFWERDVHWGETANGEALPWHRRLELAPLAGATAGQFVGELLQKVDQSPDWLVDLLVDRGGGNPYFTEELVHWLIEQNVLEAGPERWQVKADHAVALSVPGTIQGVLQARMERLSTDERASLQQAAVMGRAFWDGAVAYIGQGERSPARWAALQRRDLIFQQPTSQLPGEEEYHFKHALLRDVVYENTLRKQRQAFHRRAAEWLIRIAAERADEWAAVIATHYEQAGDRAPAAEWYGRAGRQSQETDAPAVASDYYRRALALLEGEGGAVPEVELYQRLAQTLSLQARYEEAFAAYTDMRRAAEEVGDVVAQARAWIGLSDVQDAQGDNRGVLESESRAEELARAAGAEGERAEALYGKGWALMRLGNLRAARALGEEALELSTQLGVERIVARCLPFLGSVYQMLGEWQRAQDYKEQALALHRRRGDREREATTLNSLGETARYNGDYPRAVELYQEALEISRKIGDRGGEKTYLSNLGGALVGLERYAEAEAALRQSISDAEPEHLFTLSESYSFLAEARLGQGDVADALSTAERALQLGQEIEVLEFVGRAWRVLGIVAAQCPGTISLGGTGYTPGDCFAMSLRVYAEMGAEVERARTLREWARYELARGDRAAGEAMLREARVVFERLGMPLEAGRLAG